MTRETLVKTILEDVRCILSEIGLSDGEVFDLIRRELEVEIMSNVNGYMSQFAERFSAVKDKDR